MNIIDASLFALDAYNRAEAPEDLAIPFGATVIFERVEGQFAAVAYHLPSSDEIIIAYRGTDNPALDAFTGWPIGSGQYDWAQSQADQALRFFNDLKAVVSDPTHEAHASTWSLTGHSLGGGLAGFVASIKGLPAFVYDAMPFVEAANKLYTDVTGQFSALYEYWSELAYPDGIGGAPSIHDIQSAAIEGEVNSNLRYGTPFVLVNHDVVVTSGLDSQVITQNDIKAGTVSNFIDLHSQALLTIALHGGLSHSQVREAGGEAIYHHLFDASLASHLGFTDTEWLRQHLAYSVDDDIVALDSLFADMDVLGAIVQSLEPNAHLQALGKLAIVHATEIASVGDSTLRLGLIDVIGDVANIVLSGTIGATELIDDFVQFSSTILNGQFFEIPTTSVANLAVSISGYGGEVHLASGGTMYFGTSYLDDIYGSEDDDVILSLGTDVAFHDTIRGGGGNDVIYASAGADTILDGSGNDRSHGGAGNDTFHGGTGSDAMFGDAGNDTFHLGEALEGDVDYVNGGANTTVGDTVQMSVGATYRLDVFGAAAIRNQIVPNGFTAPTGHGVGIEMAVGEAFVQGVETIKASSQANEVVIGTVESLALAGVSKIDLTSGSMDSVSYDGAQPVSLTLSADNGRSKAIQTGAAALTFLGVDEWNFTTSGNSVTVDKSHLGLQAVTIYASPGIDLLNLSSFTTGIVFGLAPTIGGTNLTVTGFERVYGGSGDDTFHGTDADEIFMGNGGTNTFHGSLGADTLSSAGGNLIVDYSLSAAPILFIRPSSSSTSANADASSSILSMGYGDNLSSTGWSDITGSTQADTLLVVGTHGTLRSNGGADTLIGSKNGDTFHAADGYAEVILPGDGSDTLHFGTGGGTLDFSTSTRAGVIDWAAGTFVFGNQTDTVTGQFSKLVGTQYGDTIHGTENADTIDGGSGSGYDVIYGRGGVDTITFRTGVVHGGDGNDVITGFSSSTIVFGEGDDDTITVGKNSLAYGGEGNDTITAGEGSTIWGDDGVDTINVTARYVTVHGGAGGDIINIAAVGWDALSTLSYSQSDAGVSVIRAGNVVLASGGHAQGDQLSGLFSVVGSQFADVFDLNVSNLGYIKGGAGNDVITLRTEDGEAHGEADDDTITLTGRYQDGYGGDGDDTFHGHGQMYGGEGDDEFYLGYGTYSSMKIGAVVRGGVGQNRIEGGAGNDTIWMDEGSDTFVYSSGGGHDRVYMAGSDDHLVLNGISGFTSTSDISANLFEDGSRTELRLGGSDQTIGFMNMTASQVLALDWAFT